MAASTEDTMTGIGIEPSKEFRTIEERDLWLDVYKSATRQRFTQFPDGSLLEMVPEDKADHAVRELRDRSWSLERRQEPVKIGDSGIGVGFDPKLLGETRR